MKSLWTGMVIGAVIGGALTTMTNGDMRNVKKKIYKMGRKFAKKCDMM